MAYVKLWKIVVDSPISFRTVNYMAANSGELRTQMLVQHGGNEPWYRVKGTGPIDYNALGKHNLPEIPRAVGFSTLYLQSLLAIGISMTWTGPSLPLVWKVGTGDYLMPVVGLSKFWAVVTPAGGSTVTYLPPQVRPFFATAANGNNAGLRINTYGLDAGDFVPTDMSFSIAVYGTP